MNYWILILIGLITANIPQGSLDGFLNSSEVNSVLANLTSTYPGLAKTSSDSGFSTLIIRNFTVDLSEYEKPTILVLGGFYAGYPLSAFQVLKIAENLLSSYDSGDSETISLVESFIFHFIPILNEEGYGYMEKNYQNGSFPVVKTGQELKNSNCSGYDIGINADRNFPYEFQQTNDKCSSDYSGDVSLSSKIAKNLVDYYFKKTSPALIFNYQGIGETYYTPYASNSLQLDTNSQKFYTSIVPSIPKPYTFGAYSNSTNTTIYGSFIDYAFNQSSLILLVAVGKSFAADKINTQTDDNILPFLSALSAYYPDVKFSLSPPSESICKPPNNSTCDIYSVITFQIEASNTKYMPFSFSFIFDAGFSPFTDYTCVNVTLTSKDSTEILNFTQNSVGDKSLINSRTVIPGYSSVLIDINIQRLYKNSTDEYHADLVINTEIFYENIERVLKGRVGEEDDSSHGYSQRKGNIVGFVLLIILLILTCISGIVLYCTRKPHELKQNLNQDPRSAYPPSRA